MERFLARHKKFWTKENTRSLIGSLGFFIVSFILEHFADNYVARVGGTPVGDLILDNLPVADVDGFIIIGTILFTAILICLAFVKPNYLNFGLKSASLFVVVRSLSITLTHLGTDPHQLVFDASAPWFQFYDFVFRTKGDYFFSGHTGVPFLMALIFWREKFWRHLFLAISIFFGLLVLLGHLHYSIDVFAAPFMTYSIFAISRYLFKQDYRTATEE